VISLPVSLAVVTLAPWVALLLYTGLWIRFPRPLPEAEPPAPSGGGRESADGSGGPRPSDDLPLVSVIVPARNEETTIGTCLGHLTCSRYPRFEVIVVDDRSEDATAELARDVGRGNAVRLRVLEGEPLPDGWLGKPWACWQGQKAATGDLLLFTDADTRHGPRLLERAVAALEEDCASAVTLMGRQLMESFWEKVVQPQFFAALAIRFPRMDRILEAGGCREAVANGQFILVEREAYESVDGHRGIRGEVVEDLRLAQSLCAGGNRMTMRMAEDAFATRMYRSLPDIVEGWSKNLATALRQTTPAALKSVVLPVSILAAIALWLVPPAILAVAGVDLLVGGGGGAVSAALSGWTGWSALVVGLSVFFWMGAAHRSRIHPGWGALYPVGSAVACFTLIRSWIRGRTVEWKGRVYRVGSSS